MTKDLIMKKFILTWAMAMTAPAALFATDRIVDPTLSVGNGSTLFSDIVSAVEAAVDGDRILITPGVYQEPAFSVAKSLSFLPTDGESTVTINANVTINVADDRKVKWVHINQGQYSLYLAGGGSRFGLTMLNSQTTTLNLNGSGNTSEGNRCELHIVDCTLNGNLEANQNGWDLALIRSSVGGSTVYRFGDVVMSTMPRLILNDEGGSNTAENRHAIIQNTISDYLEIRNDNCAFRVANNSLKNLHLLKWNVGADRNDILNNEFASDTHIHMPWNPPSWNLRFNNNVFSGAPSFVRWATELSDWNNSWGAWCDTDNDYYCGTATDPGNQSWDGEVAYYGSNALYDCNRSNCNDGGYDLPDIYSTSNAAFPNPDIAGFFEWNHNSHGLPNPAVNANDPLVYTEVGNGGENVNGGSPEHEYYDLDLTVNDRGRAGGPWGTANFPTDGKSFVFDLDIPADLFPGQEIDIKAKAYQRY